MVSDRKVDELDKAIAVAARDPASYGIDETELEKRRRWTTMARNQVDSVNYKFKFEGHFLVLLKCIASNNDYIYIYR